MQKLSKCAWCGSELLKEVSSGSDDLTDGICVNCVQDMSVLPHDTVTGEDREFVDSLPYGTIVLDEDDQIIRYNKAESKFTGLPIEEVEGRNFFQDIAPCTAVQEFQGVLNTFKKNGVSDQESIKFTFNHRNFQAFVSILITWFAEAKIAILTIKKVDEQGGESPILDEKGEEIITGTESGKLSSVDDPDTSKSADPSSFFGKLVQKIKSIF